MRLSEPLITKFQQAYLEEFGQTISAEAAESELLELAELVEITASQHLVADNVKHGDDNGTDTI